MKRLALALTLLITTAGVAEEKLHYIWSQRSDPDSVRINGALDVDRLRSLRARYDGPFLWFVLDGRKYVITDRTTLAQLEKVFAPLNALQPQYNALRQRMDKLEHEERALDEKSDALDEELERLDDEDSEKRRPLEAKMRELERAMRSLEERMRPLEDEERRLDRKEEQLEDEAERQMVPLLRRAIEAGVAGRG